MKNVINRAIMAKKKMILTLMLAIVSSVWMTSKALCQVDGCTCLFDDPPVAISGILQLVPLPCPESTEDIPCPPCLTIALNTNEQLYYLNGMNDNLNALLDTLAYPVNATVTGNVFIAHEDGGLAIRVLDISLHASLPSLCDEWNVVHISNDGDATRYFTVTQKLTTDTIINEHVYVKSDYDAHKYRGAFREGENRDIYCVPATSNEEYLVYAWNAQVGDTLYNLLVGGGIMYAFQFSERAVVREIKETVPRTFVVDYEYIYNRRIDSADTTWWEYQWIEGVGMTCGPSGDLCPFDICRGVIKSEILCAYKNGEQIYTSDLGEQYGCEYNYNPYATPTDTIPLFSYTGDDPGSSTVDPVDPNQVVATLNGGEVTIKETSGDVITYSLQKKSSNNAPKRMPTVADTFQNTVSVELTEEGLYRLDLSNPHWDYRIYGIFNYPQRHDAIDETVVPAPAAQKIIRNGQLLIQKGDKIYTVQGAEVRE